MTVFCIFTVLIMNFFLGVGNFGFYCSKCNHFIFRTKGLNSSELKLKHKCEEKVCQKCRDFYDPSKGIHLCKITQVKETDIWPSIAFLNFELTNQTFKDCLSCQKCNKNQFALHDFVKFNPKLCQKHMVISNGICNIMTIYKEDDLKKGQFHKVLLSSFEETTIEKGALSYDYTLSQKLGSKVQKKAKDISGDIKILTSKLQGSLDIMDQFLSLIFEEEKFEWKNTTFILFDEDSLKLVSLTHELFFIILRLIGLLV